MSVSVLETDGASLAYAVRGEGPFLFLVGAPGGMAGFAALAERLGEDFTVVTHDPRGIGQSRLHAHAQISPRAFAEDLHALMRKLSPDPALAFGASGGAVTGIELLSHKPDAIRILVAHEPPLFRLLPDAEDVVERADKAFALGDSDTQAAMQAFFDLTEILSSTRTGDPRPAPVPMPTMPPAELEKNRFFIGRMAPATVHYTPDIGAIDARRIVVAAGEASVGQPARRATEALCSALGVGLKEAPGNHTGPSSKADEFAGWLRGVIAEAR